MCIRDIPDVVEALEERESVNEVEALARVGAEVGDDQVYAVRVTTNGGVELKDSMHGVRSVCTLRTK